MIWGEGWRVRIRGFKGSSWVSLDFDWELETSRSCNGIGMTGGKRALYR